MPPKNAASPSETPVPSTEANPADAPALPDEEVAAMADILNYIYDYRTPEYV